MLKAGRYIALIITAFIVAANLGNAQSAASFASAHYRPMVTGQRTDCYPRLLDDNSVLFALEAPGASEVTVEIPAVGIFNMVQDGRPGVWYYHSAPLQCGFHYYWFNVDGALALDPWSKMYHGYGRECSAIDIPEPGTEWMDIQDVPHGEVREVSYWSKESSKWRKICVYTPAGYGNNPFKRYPVMYIGHGSGENNRSWMEQGRTGTILDNLIAEGKAEPMIVVSMDSQLGDYLAPYTREGMQPYGRELLESIIPFVDTHYRTIRKASARAMCGLSQGSGEAFCIGLTHPEVFSAIGLFSCGLFGQMYKAGLDFDKEVPGLLSETDRFNKQFPVIYFSCGEQDYRTADYIRLTQELKSAGLKFTYTSFEGAHEWQPWRKSVYEFAQIIFK